jgi:putative lipoprotein (rSAM/lipoprotein system)
MKTKHLHFINLSNKIILFLLSLLGFTTSCEKLPQDEYGTPNADFIINGSIKSKTTNQFIQNLKVVATSERIDMLKDSVLTDSQGKFITKIKDFPEKQTFKISISDIDGANNGSFANKDTTITFDGTTFTGGDGHWYRGKTEQNIVIYLNEKLYFPKENPK